MVLKSKGTLSSDSARFKLSSDFLRGERSQTLNVPQHPLSQHCPLGCLASLSLVLRQLRLWGPLISLLPGSLSKKENLGRGWLIPSRDFDIPWKESRAGKQTPDPEFHLLQG